MMLRFHGDQEELAGVIGLGLTLGLWCLSSWRLIFHTVWRRRRQNNSLLLLESPQRTLRSGQQRRRPLRTFSKWFTRRRTFHCLLWIATSCEALAYLDLSGLVHFSGSSDGDDGSNNNNHHHRTFSANKLGYIFLDVLGRSIELLSFSVCTNMWLHTAMEASPTRNLLLPTIFGFIIVLLVLSSATLSVVVFAVFGNKDLATIQNLPLLRAQTLLEASAWGVHSLVVLECLAITSKRIVGLVPRTQWRKRVSLLSKAVLPMLGASLVYATRCGWLIAVYCKAPRVSRGTWSWWIGFAWCPTWLAVIMLLYSARKRDQIASNNYYNNNNDPENQQPLLPRRPPAEAFLAFSQHRLESDLDDSLLCASPMPHVFASRDESAVADEETLSIDSDLERQAASAEPTE